MRRRERERYLLPGIRGERRDCVAVTEPDAGSDGGAIRTMAERVDRGYRLDGDKWFVTVGDVAECLIVLAGVRPERSPTLFIVDKDAPGVTVLRTPRYMHTLVYEHPRVRLRWRRRRRGPAVLGEVGEGYELTRD